MMPSKSKIAVAAVCALLAGPLSAHAATVSKQSGAVLVNKGGGFLSLASEAELAPGHQIMVPPGGLATITYASNCSVRVGSGVWWVQAAPPCANGTTVLDFTGRMNQQTDSGVAPPLVVGGVIVAAGVGMVILMSDGHKSASP